MFSLRFFAIIPEQSIYIIERFGKYHQILKPGFNWMVPILDRIAYRQNLKEESVEIDKQQAITKDNVNIQIDGVLFIQVEDAYKASYQVENPKQAVKLLCQTILRSEIGKIKLDQLLQERGQLNQSLFKAINNTAQGWGLKCKSVEILSIDPPDDIKKSMTKQAFAERQKRSMVIISEANQISEINKAEGKKISTILEAEGQAESVQLRAEAESVALKKISDAINKTRENRVVDYILLSNYLDGYQNVLKKSNVVVVPQSGSQSGNSNDLITLAGMMLFGNQNKVIDQDLNHNKNFTNIQQQQQQQQQQLQQQQQQQQQQWENAKQTQNSTQPSKETLGSFYQKTQYYDDVSLYPTQEEIAEQAKSKQYQRQ